MSIPLAFELPMKLMKKDLLACDGREMQVRVCGDDPVYFVTGYERGEPMIIGYSAKTDPYNPAIAGRANCRYDGTVGLVERDILSVLLASGK